MITLGPEFWALNVICLNYLEWEHKWQLYNFSAEDMTLKLPIWTKTKLKFYFANIYFTDIHLTELQPNDKEVWYVLDLILFPPISIRNPIVFRENSSGSNTHQYFFVISNNLP